MTDRLKNLYNELYGDSKESPTLKSEGETGDVPTLDSILPDLSPELIDLDQLQKEIDEVTRAVNELCGMEEPKPVNTKQVEPTEPTAETETAPTEPDEKEPEEPEKTVEELLEELDHLIGLDVVKKDIHSLIDFIKINKMREARGMKTSDVSYHMVFSGNPGTGKTTVARLLAQIYKAIGLLEKGQLIEVDRSGLVAGYLGQTAIKTSEVIKSALGGVLFIDEAYTLSSEAGDSFGKECIATILKAMEDHRDELVVIVAGYDNLMKEFIESNPGLQSRFNKYFNFPDYTGEELEQIFLLNCKKNGYVASEDGLVLLREVFQKMYELRDDNFGNGRTIRNLFEKIINCQAGRLADLVEEQVESEKKELTDEELQTLTVEDVKSGLAC